MLKCEGCSNETHSHVHSPQEGIKESCEFQSDEDVKVTLVQWFQQQPGEFFAEGISRQICQCLCGHADYFE
jgi:hypothetical protein